MHPVGYLSGRPVMSITRFLVDRLRAGKSDSFTRLILRFATGTIALCVAVILLAHALILGFKEEIKAKVFGFWGHIQITAFNPNSTFESPPISGDQSFLPVLDTLGPIHYRTGGGQDDARSTKGGIRHVQGYALKPGILTRNSQLEGILLKGAGPDFQWDFLTSYLQEGSTLAVRDSLPQREIWISRTTADRMKVKLLDDLIVYFIQGDRQVERRFRVSGIYKTGLEEYDRKFALVDIRHIREIAGWEEDQVTGFEIFVDDIADSDVFTEYIYYELMPSELYIESIRQKFPAIFDWVELQDINEQVLIILMLMVALINLATVLLILILERYNMVGILKALGASDWTIRQVFIRLSLRILIGGLLLGNLLALFIGLFQQQTGFFKLNETEYYLSQVPVRWDPAFFLLIDGVILLVAALTLLIPSLYVRYIQPVRAIRFK